MLSTYQIKKIPFQVGQVMSLAPSEVTMCIIKNFIPGLQVTKDSQNQHKDKFVDGGTRRLCINCFVCFVCYGNISLTSWKLFLYQTFWNQNASSISKQIGLIFFISSQKCPSLNHSPTLRNNPFTAFEGLLSFKKWNWSAPLGCNGNNSGSTAITY